MVGVSLAGCATSRRTVLKPGQAPAPLETATKEQLIGQFDQQARAIQSLNANVSMKLTAGSAYTGVIEQYHEVSGFVLAQKPASIRVIGQAPVAGKIFDMVSDGETFRIFIPSKNKFLLGPANLERPAAKPVENLRPQHLFDALLWEPIAQGLPVLFEEANEPSSHSYVLTVVRPAGGTASGAGATGSTDWEISEKVWFDRTNLRVARVESFGAGGKLHSDVRYSEWLPVTAGAEPGATGSIRYPRTIAIARPGNDYELDITVKKVTVNESISAERFSLEQPAGTELVRVGETSPEKQP
jgi:outer membrane lipoprotein-sorting protein